VPFGGSCERRAAAGKAGAAKLKTLGRPRVPRCGHAISSHALTLRKVCRAGFAGRGTPSALSTQAAPSLSVPDPRQSLGSPS